MIPVGTYVLLEGVVVTTPAAEVGPGVRDLYAQDREGGLYSGIHITEVFDLDLRLGNLVDVVGYVRGSTDPLHRGRR